MATCCVEGCEAQTASYLEMLATPKTNAQPGKLQTHPRSPLIESPFPNSKTHTHTFKSFAGKWCGGGGAGCKRQRDHRRPTYPERSLSPPLLAPAPRRTSIRTASNSPTPAPRRWTTARSILAPLPPPAPAQAPSQEPPGGRSAHRSHPAGVPATSPPPRASPDLTLKRTGMSPCSTAPAPPTVNGTTSPPRGRGDNTGSLARGCPGVPDDAPAHCSPPSRPAARPCSAHFWSLQTNGSPYRHYD